MAVANFTLGIHLNFVTFLWSLDFFVTFLHQGKKVNEYNSIKVSTDGILRLTQKTLLFYYR